MASMILFDTANHGTDSQFAVAWRPVWGGCFFFKSPQEKTRPYIFKKLGGGDGSSMLRLGGLFFLGGVRYYLLLPEKIMMATDEAQKW